MSDKFYKEHGVLKNYWNGNRTLLHRLYTKHRGNCCTCKKSVVIGINLANNSATVGHVYDWCDLRRHTNSGNRKVKLQCYACNKKDADKTHEKRKSWYTVNIMKEYDKKVNLIDMLKNTIKSERKPCGYLEFYCHPSSHNVRTNLFIVRSIEALNQGMADTLEVGLKTVAIGRIYLKNPNPSA